MFLAEPHGNVAIFRFDRAAKRNALTPGMLHSLAKAVETALSARAIVLSGVGDVFCAGFDLSMARDDEMALSQLLKSLAAAATALREAPCAVVASAHGAAIAGGCALLCACDFVITNKDAKLGYPAVRLGISPAVSAPMLAACMTPGGARARLLDSGVVNGREALRLGLADECEATGEACEARAIALAVELASKPAHAIAYTKRWLNELDGSLDPARSTLALDASLSGAGDEQQRERLAQLWKKQDAQ